MSVDISFFVEVRDDNGKWHLVKWFADGEFDTGEPTEYDFEKVVDFNGKRMVEKYEFCPGLAWRDELGWARGWGELDTNKGLPSDLSDELMEMIVEHGEREIERRKPLYGDKDYTFDYKSQYSYIVLADLFEHSDKKFEEWKERLKERVRDEQLDEINRRLDNLEKIALGKTDKAVKMKKTEKEYEDSVDYYLDDALFDVYALKREAGMIRDKAAMFTGDRWLDNSRIRVIYYFY